MRKRCLHDLERNENARRHKRVKVVQVDWLHVLVIDDQHDLVDATIPQRRGEHKRICGESVTNLEFGKQIHLANEQAGQLCLAYLPDGVSCTPNTMRSRISLLEQQRHLLFLREGWFEVPVQSREHGAGRVYFGMDSAGGKSDYIPQLNVKCM